MHIQSINTVNLAGYIGSVNISQGQHGPFGTISISYTDSWKDKNNNWQEKTHYIDVAVDGKRLQKLFAQLQKGDFLAIEGKLIQEQWQDKQSGANRSALKVRMLSVVTHLPKVAKQCLQQNGLAKQPNQNGNQQGGGFQGGQQGGGYQGGQQGGGYQGGQQGGRNNMPNQGGYQ
ncbi:single-stranded DNA-binding protein [Ferrimonas kyonanensis]|uniref:single-stranded DNA-binding protein n=1 Tax=Ferrimonas kyonanensis TaxID=364763 RepID=UPI0003F5D6F0|nr:single-stranded DNA-binding protein [Ferrimonas kyonanensis]